MVTAIVGGSIMPMLMGWLADHYSMGIGFIMPLVCFAAIMCYGFSWQWLFVRGHGAGSGRPGMNSRPRQSARSAESAL
jgi:hypothetical protein